MIRTNDRIDKDIPQDAYTHTFWPKQRQSRCHNDQHRLLRILKGAPKKKSHQNNMMMACNERHKMEMRYTLELRVVSPINRVKQQTHTHSLEKNRIALLGQTQNMLKGENVQFPSTQFTFSFWSLLLLCSDAHCVLSMRLTLELHEWLCGR